jgi:hypothetical protein
MRWKDITFQPSVTVLRQFSACWLLFFGCSAAWQQFAKNSSNSAAILAVVAVLIGVPGLLRPMLVRWVFVSAMIAAFPIGWVVSKVLVGLIFYLLFTPIALIFRAFGRDALYLKRPAGESYWLEKKPAANAASYLKQF